MRIVPLAINIEVANIDVVIACSKGRTGPESQRNVVIAGTSIQRKGTHGCVVVASIPI